MSKGAKTAADVLPESLKEEIGTAGAPVLVLLSGGSDSALVAAACTALLGPADVLALTVDSPFVKRSELKAAGEICRALGIRQAVVATEFCLQGKVAQNDEERCYFCKRHILGLAREAADAGGAVSMLDGTNADDRPEERPGMKAVAEAGVLSPLARAGLGKAQVHRLLDELGLSDWWRPSQSCLATRIETGTEVTLQRIGMVDSAETFLEGRGHQDLRVRLKGDGSAVVELREPDLARCADGEREMATKTLLGLGFKAVAYAPRKPIGRSENGLA